MMIGSSPRRVAACASSSKIGSCGPSLQERRGRRPVWVLGVQAVTEGFADAPVALPRGAAAYSSISADCGPPLPKRRGSLSMWGSGGSSSSTTGMRDAVFRWSRLFARDLNRRSQAVACLLLRGMAAGLRGDLRPVQMRLPRHDECRHFGFALSIVAEMATTVTPGGVACTRKRRLCLRAAARCFGSREAAGSHWL